MGYHTPTRRDYRRVAFTIKSVLDRGPPFVEGANEVAYQIADDFGQTYTNFNREKFLDAVFSSNSSTPGALVATSSST